MSAFRRPRLLKQAMEQCVTFEPGMAKNGDPQLRHSRFSGSFALVAPRHFCPHVVPRRGRFLLNSAPQTAHMPLCSIWKE
jgi:hypothetical protein